MIPSFKSEFRKLLTVRTTYGISLVSLALTAFFCLYVFGYKGNGAGALTALSFHQLLSDGASIGALFGAIVSALLVAHEYRYNTIMYTLTTNVHRTRVLAAKFGAIVIYAVLFGLASTLVALGSFCIGVLLRGASLPYQDFNVWLDTARLIFSFIAYAIITGIIAVIARSIVVAIVALFLLPTTIEPLLTLLLRDNGKYLPFNAINSVQGAMSSNSALTPGAAFWVSCLYLAIGLFVAWLLFTRRDAN
ncbi:MAG: hypothetical protein JWN38_765 [Candidatus Saccharibacteria bacterium]|nr:hypothetical protein [Candidatus Saccharibacteria bacterium]